MVQLGTQMVQLTTQMAQLWPQMVKLGLKWRNSGQKSKDTKKIQFLGLAVLTMEQVYQKFVKFVIFDQFLALFPGPQMAR